MKMVINGSYGGFEVPDELEQSMAKYDFDDPDMDYGRSDPVFIDWVLAHKGRTDLRVVEIPDDATDYYINEYDGWESVIYVLDGKLHWAD